MLWNDGQLQLYGDLMGMVEMNGVMRLVEI